MSVSSRLRRKSRWLLASAWVGALGAACATSEDPDPAAGRGGQSGSSGAKGAQYGGATSFGGTSFGGAPSQGGAASSSGGATSSSSGGASAGEATTASGGKASAGSTGSGGSTVVASGGSSAGGRAAVGGSTASALGGASTASGGSSVSGGETGVGGDDGGDGSCNFTSAACAAKTCAMACAGNDGGYCVGACTKIVACVSELPATCASADDPMCVKRGASGAEKPCTIVWENNSGGGTPASPGGVATGLFECACGVDLP